MITTADILQQLRPGLNAVFGNYAIYPDQWKPLFTTSMSSMQQEIEVEDKFLRPAEEFGEGQGISYDDMQVAYQINYLHKKVGLGFQITREAIDDNLYKTQFPQRSVALRNALAIAKNTFAADVFNNAFNPYRKGGDGQPMCSDLHPLVAGGTSSNLGIASQLNEASVEAALIGISQMRGQNGALVQVKARRLAVSPFQAFNASRIRNSQFRPGTANNDINAIYHDSWLPEQTVVNHYFLGNAWFIMTDAENGLKHFQRTPIQTDGYVAFDTDVAMFKAWERYSFGWSNWRGVYGNQGLA